MENNYEPDYYDNQFEENKRPGFLTFLCILTFIGSGFSLLSQLLMPMIAPITLEFMQGGSFASYPVVIEQYEQLAATPVWQFYLLAFFYAASIIGAVYILKMKKIGFHIYAISQLLILAAYQFIIGGTLQPKFSTLLFTALFIGLYAIYYKKFSGLDDEVIR